VRTLLEEMKLVGFLKTTGGKGLHVVVPIRATLTWDDAKRFARGVAEHLARTFPDRFTATLSKEARRGMAAAVGLLNVFGGALSKQHSDNHG